MRELSQGDDSFYMKMDGIEDAEHDLAGYCCSQLSRMYPGHPWPVEVHIGNDGVPNITIRHWALAQFGPYGYFINGRDIISPTSLHKLLLQGGGEILERLGFPRVGGWDGTIPEGVEETDPRFDKRLRGSDGHVLTEDDWKKVYGH
jgi:hypothetical protein